MKAHHQIEITLNTSQFGYEKNRQQILLWLHNVIPVIVQKQKIVTEKIFLPATKRFTNFCLS